MAKYTLTTEAKKRMREQYGNDKLVQGVDEAFDVQAEDKAPEVDTEEEETSTPSPRKVETYGIDKGMSSTGKAMSDAFKNQPTLMTKVLRALGYDKTGK